MQINSGYGDAKEERLQRTLVDFKFTDYSHETLESVTVNLKDLFEEYGYIPKAKAIPIEQLLSILPKYDDYIHTKTYPYNETMEDIYSKGYEDGWNVCLKHIKEELDYWEKENE